MIIRFLFSLLFALVLPLVAQAQTGALMMQLQSELASEQDELTAGFSIAPARAQIARGFENNNVEFSERFLDRWSAEVSARWTGYEVFFTEHLARLDAWQAAIEAGDVSAEEAQDQLRVGLARTAIVAAAMQDWMQSEVQNVIDRAIWTDLAHDIGCCEPLYYHALSEAEIASEVSQSPDPLRLQTLILLPNPPGADPEALPLTTREAALTDLTLRAEALEADPGADVAGQAGLLAEAALLTTIFSDRQSDSSQLQELQDLAARVGFDARPTAPLLSLAAITEAGPQREFLLNAARERLANRAAYLATLADEEAQTPSRRNAVSTSQNFEPASNTIGATTGFSIVGTMSSSTVPAPSFPSLAAPVANAPAAAPSVSEDPAETAVEEALDQLMASDVISPDAVRAAEQADALLSPQNGLEPLISFGF